MMHVMDAIDTAMPRAVAAHTMSKARQLAYMHLLSGNSINSLQDADAWLTTCARLTRQMERVALRGVLLDLGICSSEEARVAMEMLMRRIKRLGYVTLVGIAPSLTLAQLACFTSSPGQAL